MSDPVKDPSDAMTTADAIPAGEAMPAADPMPAAVPMPAADPTATADQVPTADPIPAADPTAAPVAATGVVTAPAVAAPVARRRLGSAALAARVLRLAFAVALLVGGGYAGYQMYLASRPAAAIPGDPGVVGTATPPAVAELAAAIGSDDANAIRVALTADMFSSYAADLERFGITRVQSVETLGTFDDGDRSATALVILGQTTDGSPFTINLVVIAQGGQIVRLR